MTVKQMAEKLKCGVERLEYDFVRRQGRAWFPAGHCCDMAACVRLFQSIDPGVRHIQTYSGDRPDTGYRLVGGKFLAG